MAAGKAKFQRGVSQKVKMSNLILDLDELQKSNEYDAHDKFHEAVRLLIDYADNTYVSKAFKDLSEDYYFAESKLLDSTEEGNANTEVESNVVTNSVS